MILLNQASGASKVTDHVRLRVIKEVVHGPTA